MVGITIELLYLTVMIKVMLSYHSLQRHLVIVLFVMCLYLRTFEESALVLSSSM